MLGYLRRRAEERPLVQAPAEHPDPYMGAAGSHPDIVERVWDRIGPALSADCRAVVVGAPALVHPDAGVVLAVALGSSYALRLVAADLQDAVAGGAELSHEHGVPKGHVLDLPTQFGSDWAFGRWDDSEPGWCARTYHAWDVRGRGRR